MFSVQTSGKNSPIHGPAYPQYLQVRPFYPNANEALSLSPTSSLSQAAHLTHRSTERPWRKRSSARSTCVSLGSNCGSSQTSSPRYWTWVVGSFTHQVRFQLLDDPALKFLGDGVSSSLSLNDGFKNAPELEGLFANW